MMLDTLAHLFVPQYSNNHRARLLHNSSLIILTLFFLIHQFVIHTIPHTGARVLGYAANISVNEVISLTNTKRAETGVGGLTVNQSLNEAAKKKGEDMLARDYWAHVAPDGTEPWKFFDDAGYVYRYAGENLARDFSNAQDAVNAWMASPSHKENLLSSKYNEIGVAVVEGDLNGVDTTLIVQLFGTRNIADQVNVPIVKESVAAAITNDSEPLNDDQDTAQVPTEEQQNTNLQIISPVANQAYVSPFTLTQTFSLLLVGMLLLVVVIDGVVVAKNNIPRISGRTLAHFAFLSTIFVIIVIARAGDIL